MRILEPLANITRIIEMIEQSEKFVIMVSPYSFLEGWDRLKKAINEAPSRGVDFSYYVRQGEGLAGLDDLKVKIHEVPGLHAKMFFSEKEAIISSFHLMNNNDINWACVMDYPEEYNDLVGYFDEYIKKAAVN